MAADPDNAIRRGLTNLTFYHPALRDNLYSTSGAIDMDQAFAPPGSPSDPARIGVNTTPDGYWADFDEGLNQTGPFNDELHNKFSDTGAYLVDTNVSFNSEGYNSRFAEAGTENYRSIQADGEHYGPIQADGVQYGPIQGDPEHYRPIQADDVHYGSIQADPEHYGPIQADGVYYGSIQAGHEQYGPIQASGVHYQDIQAAPDFWINAKYDVEQSLQRFLSITVHDGHRNPLEFYVNPNPAQIVEPMIRCCECRWLNFKNPTGRRDLCESNDARYNPMGLRLTGDCSHLVCDNCPEVWPYWWCVNQLCDKPNRHWSEYCIWCGCSKGPRAQIVQGPAPILPPGRVDAASARPTANPANPQLPHRDPPGTSEAVAVAARPSLAGRVPATPKTSDSPAERPDLLRRTVNTARTEPHNSANPPPANLRELNDDINLPGSRSPTEAGLPQAECGGVQPSPSHAINAPPGRYSKRRGRGCPKPPTAAKLEYAKHKAERAECKAQRAEQKAKTARLDVERKADRLAKLQAEETKLEARRNERAARRAERDAVAARHKAERKARRLAWKMHHNGEYRDDSAAEPKDGWPKEIMFSSTENDHNLAEEELVSPIAINEARARPEQEEGRQSRHD